MARPLGTVASAPVDAAVWSSPLEDLLLELGTTPDGLTAEEASRRLAAEGANAVTPPTTHPTVRLLLTQFTSPVTLILAVATVLSIFLGDLADGAIILVILLAGGLLGFAQEHRAGRSVEALLDRVRIHTDLLRDGVEHPLPVEDVVRGDVVVLRAGDVVPADARLIRSQNLLVDQGTLTGEAYPAEKEPGVAPAGVSPTGRTNAVFLGTHVVSGTATAVVVATGARTEFGALAARLAARDVTTRFERGLSAFGGLLLRAMTVLLIGVFLVNVALQRPVIEALLFSLAIAVGVTPQLLPAVVAVSLAAGARRMAQERVIVKRLDAVEDFGGMTLLCTDKTGTVTSGSMRLDRAVDLSGAPSAEVLELARLNAGLQRAFTNPLDDALLAGVERPDATRGLGEVPYDFHRRRISVLVGGSPPLLVTKGAVQEVLDVCSGAAVPGASEGPAPIATARADVLRLAADLTAQGLRVVAVATRELPGAATVTADDEAGLAVRGLLAFDDPPRPGAAAAVAELMGLGVSVRLITGDTRLAAATAAAHVGLPSEEVLLGPEIAATDVDRLAVRIRDVHVFAEVEPLDKVRLVEAFRRAGETVGFLGDGINDTAALHVADVGISVDTAVDVAKQAASIVLLEKDLSVIVDGVRLGRRTFTNTVKYIGVTISANFGNMLSMTAAAAFLPFLPLLPRQILLLNFLSDIPAMTIAGDRVDEEQEQAPGRWDIRGIRSFMITYGLVSSVFDVLTFLLLAQVVHADAALFRSAWFIVSTGTELCALLVLRTARPAWRSRPSPVLVLASVAVAAATVALPYSGAASALGLRPVPAGLLLALAALTLTYVLANEVVKAAVRRSRSTGTAPRPVGARTPTPRSGRPRRAPGRPPRGGRG